MMPVQAFQSSASFHEVQFPTDISTGAVGGPEFKTTVLTLGSGDEKRNVEWSLTRYQGNIGTGLRRREDFEEFQKFFYARMGRAYGFRFKDWSDFQIIEQQFTVGDGVVEMVGGTAFQIYKQYLSGDYLFIRPILKPVATPEQGTEVVKVNGVAQTLSASPGAGNYLVDRTTGILTFGAPLVDGDEVEITYMEFDIPVRFDIDKLDMNMAAYEAGQWLNIPIVELKNGK